MLVVYPASREKGRASRQMTSVLRENPLSSGSAYRASSITATRPARSTARVRLHLKPGQKGTKQLLAQYGDRLICVRYRYDAQRKKRFKTVELLVAERDWEPPRSRFTDYQIVWLCVAFADAATRQRVKQAGGTWNPTRRLWQLRYDRAIALGLGSRIVADPASIARHPQPTGENLHPYAPARSR
jgi:hypothetical protein